MLILLATLPLLAILSSGWRFHWDGAIYISLSRALAEGEGYRYLGHVLTKYPPGLPLLLLPAHLLFDGSILAMRVTLTLCLMAAVVMIFRYLRGKVGLIPALGIALLTAWSPTLFYESTFVRSELPFLLFSTTALVCGERWLGRPNRRSLGALSLALNAAFSMRTVGIILGPAIALAMIEKAWRQSSRHALLHAGLLITITALLAGAWSARDLLTSDPLSTELVEATSYSSDLTRGARNDQGIERAGLSAILERPLVNAPAYLRHIGRQITSSRLSENACLIAGLWFLLGFLIAFLSRRSSLEWYVLAYLAIYCLWPDVRIRYASPLLPWAFYYAFIPFLALAKTAKSFQLRPQLQWALCAALVCIITLVNARHLFTIVQREHSAPYDYLPRHRDTREALKWIKQHTDKNAVLAADQGPVAHYLAQRKAYAFLRTKDPQRLFQFLQHFKVTHIIADQWGNSELYLKPIISKHPEPFRLVHQVGGVTVYAVSP